MIAILSPVVPYSIFDEIKRQSLGYYKVSMLESTTFELRQICLIMHALGTILLCNTSIGLRKIEARFLKDFLKKGEKSEQMHKFCTILL